MNILFALAFYVVFSLFGLIGLPLVARLTSNRQLALSISKIAGLVVYAYFVWLASYLGLLDYQNRWLVRGIFCFLAILGAIAIWKARPTLRDFLWIEVASLVLYSGYLFLRTFNPSAEGTEHFMDMALLASASKTHSFPFIDPWYSGNLINYYYYGSYTLSLISNLAGVPYAVSYNLALGLIYSQSALLSGVLTFALTGLKRFGVLAGFLVTTAGTLFYGQCAIRGALSTPATACSYAASTRFYMPSYIINEIPSYSFTVGNLHAHLIALPFFLFGLCLLYLIALARKPSVTHFLLLAVTFATSGMTNSWDAITLFSLLAVLIALKAHESSAFRPAVLWVACGAGTVATVVLLMSPALRHFQSPVLGIGFIPTYIGLHGLMNVQSPTPVTALAGMWGAYLLGILAVFATKRRKLGNWAFLAALLIVSTGILIGIELFFIKDVYSLTNPPYFRANTTFKFGYHAWVLLSVVFATCVATARRRWLTILCVVVILGGVVYPFEAIRQYYLTSPRARTLDSSAWMKDSAGDWDTVQYINRNIRERSVIAEAVGESYSTHSRITTYTGMATPMGWQWHEWTWRFRSGEAAKAPLDQLAAASWAPISIAAQYVGKIYTTHDSGEARAIIDQLHIDYVYVGALERKTYPLLDEAKFYSLGKVEFESQGSKLFSVSHPASR